MEKTLPINPVRKWGPLFVLGFALAIIIIDTTLLNVSIGTIIRELNTDIQQIQWVITTYSLTLAALTITGGRLGDLFGRKRMFVTGAFLFAVGSLIASISPNVMVLLLGESIIEGIGASLMMPATASLLVSNYQGDDRAIAFGIWGGIAGASSAVGPILGGFLTNTFSWRWGFRINVFVVLLLLAGSFIIHEVKSEKKTSLDIVGVFLSGIGLLGIVFGIVESSRYGWWLAKETFTIGSLSIQPGGFSIVPFSLMIGAWFLVFFFLWEQFREKQGKTPLVSLAIFKNRVFVSGVLTIGILTLGQVGMVFGLPIFLQAVQRLDAFQTGLALLPLSLTLLIMAPLSGVISKKIRPKYLILTGLLLDIIGMFVLRSSINLSATANDFIPGLVLIGSGMGMVMAQISNLTLSSVPMTEAGEASGINNTMRQIGSTLGSAVIGAVLLTTLTTGLTKGIAQSQAIPAEQKPVIIAGISKNASNLEFGGSTAIASSLPKPILKEIVRITHESTVIATRKSLLIAAFFVMIGFLVAMTLPDIRKTRSQSGPSAGH